MVECYVNRELSTFSTSLLDELTHIATHFTGGPAASEIKDIAILDPMKMHQYWMLKINHLVPVSA